MISFTKNNADIIERLKTVKGLLLVDRQLDYKKRLQKDVRTRLAADFQLCENCWQRKELYLEAINLLFEFEFEFLLLSIYFDEDDDYLLDQLNTVLSSHKPINFTDRYSLLGLLNRRDDAKGRVREFLDKLFAERAGLRALRRKVESNEFPEINQIGAWIQSQMKDAKGADNVSFALLHFAKFWQLRYAQPFNYSAGILFLAKLEQRLKQVKFEDTKVDFGNALRSVVSDISSILPQKLNSPILNLFDPNSLTGLSHAGYLKRIHDFKQWLSHNALMFQDLRKYTFTELFSGFCNSSKDVQQVFVKEIKERFNRCEVLSPQEVEYFLAIESSSLDSASNHLYHEIRRINYLFF